MKITKAADSFDLYRAELSYTQLAKLAASLRLNAGGDLESDELLAGLEWYLARLPKPGQDKEDAKPEKEPAEPAAVAAEVPADPTRLKVSLGTLGADAGGDEPTAPVAPSLADLPDPAAS